MGQLRFGIRLRQRARQLVRRNSRGGTATTARPRIDDFALAAKRVQQAMSALVRLSSPLRDRRGGYVWVLFAEDEVELASHQGGKGDFRLELGDLDAQ
jgi:hypothetical protein